MKKPTIKETWLEYIDIPITVRLPHEATRQYVALLQHQAVLPRS